MSQTISNVEGCRMSKGLEGCLEGSRMSKGLEGCLERCLECRRVSKDVSNVECRMSKGLEGCLERCLECRRVSLDVSLDISKDVSKDVSKDGYAVFQAYYSPLLVLVCRSVSQDPPPGRLKTLLLRRPFYTLRRQRSANQRSRMPTRHLADQSAIASRRTPPISDQSFALRKFLLN